MRARSPQRNPCEQGLGATIENHRQLGLDVYQAIADPRAECAAKTVRPNPCSVEPAAQGLKKKCSAAAVALSRPGASPWLNTRNRPFGIFLIRPSVTDSRMASISCPFYSCLRVRASSACRQLSALTLSCWIMGTWLW